MTGPSNHPPAPPAPPAPPSDAELLLPRGWPDVTRPAPPDRKVLAAVAVAAVGTDLAVRSGVQGLAGALLVLAVAAGLLASGRVTNRRAWPLLLAAPLFGLGLVSRAAEWLVFLDIVAAAGLLALGASFGRDGDPTDQSIPGLLGRAVHVAIHGVLAVPFLLARPAATHAGSAGTTVAVVRGLLLGAPVLLVLGLLLGSADPVFASFFHVPTDAGDVVVHAILLAIGATGAAMLHRTTSSVPYDLDLTGRRLLGTVEAATVLSALVAVFATFAASQVVALVGGADYVRRTAGLSYAEYARSGFFQLLAAAAITLGVLLVLRAAVRQPDHRALVGLSEAAVVLTLVLVAGAVRRLGLYEQAYGLTLLRLWSVLFALWIGGVFVLLGFAVAGVGKGRAWFVPAALALGLAGLLVLDVANPEALIARRNLTRFAGTERFDADALGELSDDAVPAIVAELDRLSPTERVAVLGRLCVAAPDGRRAGVWAFNGAVDAAAEARARVCPTGEA
jgi:hypothetical protein